MVFELSITLTNSLNGEEVGYTGKLVAADKVLIFPLSIKISLYGSTLEGSDPHVWVPVFEVGRLKGILYV